MVKLNKEFFIDNEVLFVGYSSKNNAFSKSIYQAFMNNGIKVYPLNNKADSSFDIKVYRSLGELPKVPSCAFVLTNKTNAAKVVNELSSKGVKRILFQNSRYVDQDILDTCSKYGIETAVGCPMMLFGKGMHRLHAFFAGVKR